jgi:D-proline reductase (dithiol) PrdB
MEVDSFRYLPSLVKRYYQWSSVNKELPIPFTPLARPLEECRFGLVTSGGLYHTEREPGFDQAGERANPAWGDPSFRTLPVDMDPSKVGVSHLHIAHPDILADMNILLPVRRFGELAAQGIVGGLASHAYSFMGYQGFPSDLRAWKGQSGPAVRDRLLAEQADCVLLTTA